MTSSFETLAPELTKGGAWMLAMRLFIRVLGLVNVVILARLLSPEDFGIVAMATLVVGLLQLFADVNVDLLLLRESAVDRRQMNVAWTLQVVAGVAITVLLLLLSPLLVAYYDEPRVALALVIVAFQPAIAGFENVGVVEFRRQLQFRREFWYWVLRHLIRFGFGLGLVLALRSYVALAIAVPMSAVITVAVSYWMSPFRPQFEFQGVRELWRSARWLVTMNVGQYLTYRADEFVVGGFAGSSNMGAYYVASDVATIANREIVGAVGRAVYPTISTIKENAGETRQAFVHLFGFHMISCLAVGSGLALVASELVPLLLGDQWLAGVPIFRWIALCSIFESLVLATLPFFITAGRERFVGLFHAAHAVGLIAVLVAVRQWEDLVLIAQARCLIGAIALGYCVMRVHRAGHATWTDILQASWRPVLATLLMAAVVSAVSVEGAVLLVKALAGAVSFTAALLILWVLAGRPQSPEADAMAAVGRWRTRER